MGGGDGRLDVGGDRRLGGWRRREAGWVGGGDGRLGGWRRREAGL